MKKFNLQEYFKIVKILGKGTFSQVYKIESLKNKKIYALKKVDISYLSEKEKNNSFKEIKIWKEVSSNFIVKFYDSFIDSKDNSLCIIMEILEGGDLYDLIKKCKIENRRLNKNICLSYFFQILEALSSLHKNNIFHRDLKSANIFLNKNLKIAKIGDFNVSIQVNNSFAYTQTGTPFYAAPEIWRDEPYNSKADIWSLGCILYELCMLRPPFIADDAKKLNEKIQNSNFSDWDYFYDDDILGLIRKCLIVNPESRYSAEDLLKEKDFFFKKNETILPIKPKQKTVKKTNFKLLKIKSNNNITNLIKLNNSKNKKTYYFNKVLPNRVNLKQNALIKHIQLKKKRKIKTAINTNHLNNNHNHKKLKKSFLINKKSVKTKKLQKYKLPEFLKKSKDTKRSIKNNIVKKKRVKSSYKKYNNLLDKIIFKRNLILKSANYKKLIRVNKS